MEVLDLSTSTDSNELSHSSWCQMPLYSSIATNSSTTASISSPSSLQWCLSQCHACHRHFYITTRQLYGQLRRYYLIYLHAIICRVLSVVCFAASIMILWSELGLAASSLQSPIGYLILSSKHQSNASDLTQLITFFSLLYMSVCTYWSLFQLNLGIAYSLQGPNHTTSSSLIFNGEYLSRLQFTLGYNFLLILDIQRLVSVVLSVCLASISLDCHCPVVQRILHLVP